MPWDRGGLSEAPFCSLSKLETLWGTTSSRQGLTGRAASPARSLFYALNRFQSFWHAKK